MSVSFDAYAMGEQAGDMARRILTGTPVSEIPAAAEKVYVKVNKEFVKVAGF